MPAKHQNTGFCCFCLQSVTQGRCLANAPNGARSTLTRAFRIFSLTVRLLRHLIYSTAQQKYSRTSQRVFGPVWMHILKRLLGHSPTTCVACMDLNVDKRKAPAYHGLTGLSAGTYDTHSSSQACL